MSNRILVAALAVGATVRDTDAVDAAAQYRHLIALGRDEFLAAAAPAALVRFRAPGGSTNFGESTLTLEESYQSREQDETLAHGDYQVGADLEVFPLAKKPGASFPDRITIGRTSNNDVSIVDASVSRLHAYLRQQGTGWVVADAGSKNGSWLKGETLTARRERPIRSRELLRLGDVDLTFYLADDLFEILGGRA